MMMPKPLLSLALALSTAATLAQTTAPSAQTAAPAPAANPIPPAAAARGEIYPLPHALRITFSRATPLLNHTTGWGTAFCERPDYRHGVLQQFP